MKFIHSSNRCFKLTTMAALIVSANMAYAGAFQLWEENPGSLGNNHAGAAAEANSAADEFYNPAGIVRAKHTQVSVGGTQINFHTAFQKGGKIDVPPPLKPPFPIIGGDFITTQNASGGTNNFVPNLHVVTPLTSKLSAAFGLTVPFGLETDYSNTKYAKFFATKTRLEGFNINPSLAYAITPKFSLGVGFDALYGAADFNNSVRVEIHHVRPLPPPPPTVIELNFLNQLAGWGYGYNAGALYQFSPATRVGLSYRSKIIVDATGKSSLGQEEKNNATATLPLPATAILSLYQKAGAKWVVLASAYYIQWDVFKNLTIKNTALGGDVSQSMNFKNTWKFTVGTNYHLSQKWMLKFGFDYDQTPTVNGHRDIRLPDSDHYTLATGAHLQATHKLGIDVGYAHIFTPDAKTNAEVNTPKKIEPNLKILGLSKGSADLFAIQVNYDFE